MFRLETLALLLLASLAGVLCTSNFTIAGIFNAFDAQGSIDPLQTQVRTLSN